MGSNFWGTQLNKSVRINHWGSFLKLQSYEYVIIAILILIAHLYYVFNSDINLNCDVECGESLLSLNASSQFRQIGLKDRFVENLGTPMNPLYYTHNINLGNIIFMLLEALEISDKSKFIFPYLIFLISLILFFKLIKLISNNNLIIATGSTFILATSYFQLSVWSTNSLRVWHFLAYTLTLLSYVKNYWNWMFIGLLISLTCGYEYFTFISLNLIIFTIVYSRFLKRDSFISLLKVTTAILFSFSLIFFLRILTISSLLGYNFTLTDIKYTLGIKIPIFSFLLNSQQMETIDSFYSLNQVLRPPATPSTSISSDILTAFQFLENFTFPRYGSVAIIITILYFIYYSLSLRKPLIKINNFKLLGPIIFSSTVSCLISLWLFRPFGFHVYLKHEMPLLTFIIQVGFAIVFGVTLNYSFTSNKFKAFIILSFMLLFSHVYVQGYNFFYSPKWDLSYVEYLKKENANKIFFINYPSSGANEKSPLFIKPLFHKNIEAVGVNSVDSIFKKQLDKSEFIVYHEPSPLVDYMLGEPTCSWREPFVAFIADKTNYLNSTHLNCFYKNNYITKDTYTTRYVKVFFEINTDFDLVLESDQFLVYRK